MPKPKPPAKPIKGLNQRQEGFCDGEGKGRRQPGRGVTYNQGFKFGRSERDRPKPTK